MVDHVVDLLRERARHEDGAFTVVVETAAGERLRSFSDRLQWLIDDPLGDSYVETWDVVPDGLALAFGATATGDIAVAAVEDLLALARELDPQARIVMPQDSPHPWANATFEQVTSLNVLLVPFMSTSVEARWRGKPPLWDALVDLCVPWWAQDGGAVSYYASVRFFRASADFVRDRSREMDCQTAQIMSDDGTGRSLSPSGHWGVVVGVAATGRDPASFLDEVVELMRASAPLCSYSAAWLGRFGDDAVGYQSSARRGGEPDLPPDREAREASPLFAPRFELRGTEHLDRVSDVFGAQVLDDAHRLPDPLPSGWSIEQVADGRRLLIADDTAAWFGEPAYRPVDINLRMDAAREQFPDLIRGVASRD